jgi:hypothetical protein
VFFYYNDFTHVYEPTILAVFRLSHPRRDECQVTVGLGDPTSPVAAKQLMMQSGGELHSGSHPFPSNKLAMDISEFASLVDDYDLFLVVENSGPTACSIESFQVEFYTDYDDPPFRILTGATGVVPASTTGVVFCGTEGTLSLSEIVQVSPLSRAARRALTVVKERPNVLELRMDMAKIGVLQPGRNYNRVFHGRYGTGFQPPSSAVWQSMTKLRRLDTLLGAASFENASVDHSATPYFPPIANQGPEGSCVAFSLGYYIGTYVEAREHGWDLSSVTWVGDPGAPSSQQDKILSPDFIYHQINSGKDEGSFYKDAASLLIQMGGASWQRMPYDTNDSTSWPSEAAFREAARYRGRQVGDNYWGDAYSDYGSYFLVETDEDVALLLSLLQMGYCVSLTIDAGTTYDRLDANDVIDTSEMFTVSLNHAQTIVGFKDGTAWDPANPD